MATPKKPRSAGKPSGATSASGRVKTPPRARKPAEARTEAPEPTPAPPAYTLAQIADFIVALPNPPFGGADKMKVAQGFVDAIGEEDEYFLLNVRSRVM